jgi:hypothetical protein
VGRPNRRWIEEVERELKGMGVKKIVEEAKV